MHFLVIFSSDGGWKFRTMNQEITATITELCFGFRINRGAALLTQFMLTNKFKVFLNIVQLLLGYLLMLSFMVCNGSIHTTVL